MNENVNVCITPKGDKPVLHFSQFDNENVFTVTVLADDGESAAVLTGLDIEFRLRKTDSHVVTIAPESVADNVITFKTTEQLCACCGHNIASVVLMKDDMVISTLDILVEIQRDILSGGLTSESDIRNLTTQIEQIVPEVLGDDYYTKTEVDELIDDIPTFDPSNYYDKSDVDDLLDDKADKSAIASLIVQKDVAKAPIASFNTDLNDNLTKCIVDINPVQSGTGTPSPDNVRPISGFSALNVTRTGLNLWNEVWELGGIGPDGNNIAKTDRIRSKNFIPVKPNLSVFINYSDSRTVNFYVCEYDINKTFIQRTTSNKNTVFTTSANCCYIRFFVYSAANPVTTYNNDISINYPSSDTEYHAYNGQTTTVNFGQTVYGGVADVTNGKLTITHKIINLWDFNFSYNSVDATPHFTSTIAISDSKKPSSHGTIANILCSQYDNSKSWISAFGSEGNNGYIALTPSGLFGISDDRYTSPSDFKTALQTENAKLVYELATPIEITTTPENLTAISGENNVYGETNGDIAVRFTETIGNELGV